MSHIPNSLSLSASSAQEEERNTRADMKQKGSRNSAWHAQKHREQDRASWSHALKQNSMVARQKWKKDQPLTQHVRSSFLIIRCDVLLVRHCHFLEHGAGMKVHGSERFDDKRTSKPGRAPQSWKLSSSHKNAPWAHSLPVGFECAQIFPRLLPTVHFVVIEASA